MKSKRGVSPIIATVLLIAMTFVIAALIFFWSKSFVKEQVEKFGKSTGQICNDLEYQVDLVHVSADLYDIYIVNTGNIPINAIDLKKSGKGKSEVDRRAIDLIEGGSTKQTVTLERKNYDKVTIIPVILGTVKGTGIQKSYNCPEEFGKQLTLDF